MPFRRGSHNVIAISRVQLRPHLQALAASTDYFPGGKQNLCNLPRVFDPSIPGCADACAFGSAVRALARTVTFQVRRYSRYMDLDNTQQKTRSFWLLTFWLLTF